MKEKIFFFIYTFLIYILLKICKMVQNLFVRQETEDNKAEAMVYLNILWYTYMDALGYLWCLRLSV